MTIDLIALFSRILALVLLLFVILPEEVWTVVLCMVVCVTPIE